MASSGPVASDPMASDPMVSDPVASASAASDLEASASAASASMLVEPTFILMHMRTLLPDPEAAHAQAADAPLSPSTLQDRDAHAIEAGESLWDLSADRDSAAFMRGHGIMSLLLEKLCGARVHSARLMEICAGTAANLVAVDPPSSEALLATKNAPQLFGALLARTTDAPTLSELLRLLSALLADAARAASVHKAGSAAASLLSRWLESLGEKACLAALAFFMNNTLRSDVLVRVCTLLSTLLYACSIADQSTTSSALAVKLLSLGTLPSLADLTASLLASRDQPVAAGPAPPSDEASITAVLQLIDRLATAATPGTTALVSSHPLYPALSELAVRSTSKPLCSLAVTVLASLLESGETSGAGDGGGGDGVAATAGGNSGGGDSDGTGLERMRLQPQLIHGALRVLRDAETALMPEEDAAASGSLVGHADGDLVDGVQAAWALLHSAVARIDGFALCLQTSGGGGVQHGAFSALLARSRALRRACEWAGHAQNTLIGVNEIARATVQGLLDVIDVVVTAGGCAEALGGDHGLGSDEEMNGMVGGGGTATDAVLRAHNVLRACLDGEQHDSGDEGGGAADAIEDWQSSNEGSEVGFGDGLPTNAHAGANAWASLSDEES